MGCKVVLCRRGRGHTHFATWVCHMQLHVVPRTAVQEGGALLTYTLLQATSALRTPGILTSTLTSTLCPVCSSRNGVETGLECPLNRLWGSQISAGEAKLDNPDQRVTADIACFASEFAEILPTLFKPILDIVVFTRQLCLVLGASPPPPPSQDCSPCFLAR